MKLPDLLQSIPIRLASQAVDLRKGILGLSLMASEHLQGDPQKQLFIFYNRNRDKLKGLFWHGNGFILLCKNLEQGRFYVPNLDQESIELSEDEFTWLLSGLNWPLLSGWHEKEYGYYG